MGKYRQMLKEGMDVGRVVDRIKKEVMQFKKMQERDEELFHKELSKVEDQAKKALGDIVKVLSKHKNTLEAMYDDKWTDHIDHKLVECGNAVMGVIPAITGALTEGDMAPEEPKPEGEMEPEHHDDDDDEEKHDEDEA